MLVHVLGADEVPDIEMGMLRSQPVELTLEHNVGVTVAVQQRGVDIDAAMIQVHQYGPEWRDTNAARDEDGLVFRILKHEVASQLTGLKGGAKRQTLQASLER